MSADPLQAALLTAVAACQPVSMRMLLQSLRPQGFSAGRIRAAATGLVQAGELRLAAAQAPFLYALPLPVPGLERGPVDRPFTEQVLHTLVRAGRGLTAGELIAFYAQHGKKHTAVRMALMELQTNGRVDRTGQRGQFTYHAMTVSSARTAGATVVDLPTTLPPSQPVALAPDWKLSTSMLGLLHAPLTWRIAA